MFTGLIQGVGRVTAITARGAERRFVIAPPFSLADCELGESIAVNGVCLTVETFDRATFSAYASAETLDKSGLDRLATGSAVNLERALAVGDRLGGHIVSGHVDCLGRVAAVTSAGESTIYRIAFPAEKGGLVVPKGSIALDGISLTINGCGPDWLEVNIIPATQAGTTISEWKTGRPINLEFDVVGKYVQRMLAPYLGEGGGEGLPKPLKGSVIDDDFLSKHGF